MSVFVCGEIVFGTQQTNTWLDDYSRTVTKAAWDQGLHVSLACNIQQKIVFEMLGREPLSYDAAHLPFLLTHSPLANTSEEVIDASVFGYDSIARLREGLEKTKAFMQALWIREVHGVIMVLADAGATADSFVNASVSLTDFVEMTLSHFADYSGMMPDLRLVVQKGR